MHIFIITLLEEKGKFNVWEHSLYIFRNGFLIVLIWKHKPLRLGQKNTPTASLQRGKTSRPTSFLDITLNHPTVWLHYHDSQAHSVLEGYYLLEFHLWIKLNCLTIKLYANKWMMLNWIFCKRISRITILYCVQINFSVTITKTPQKQMFNI